MHVKTYIGANSKLHQAIYLAKPFESEKLSQN